MGKRAHEVDVLIHRSLRDAWRFDELPWEITLDPERRDLHTAGLLDAGLPQVTRMTPAQRHELAFAEACYHLSNLLAGERSGERLAAQAMILGERDVELLAIIAQEEAKHYLALDRYLRRKAGRCYRPARVLVQVIDALEQSGSAEVKLLVGQVVLEWTAAALITSLVARVREPLLRSILRLNLRDEARHIAYGYLLRPLMAREFARSRPRRELEDLVYEAVRASAATLLAMPAWREFGLPLARARRVALERITSMGVLQRYRDLVPQQLQRYGFPVERLRRRLESDLEPALATTHA